MAEASASLADSPVEERRLRRDVGSVGILFCSVGIVIGSGWLFAARQASELAGPAALISWLVGGVAILILGLNLAELGGMYAVSGGMVRYPHAAFGSMVGFASGWFYYIGSVTTAPIETEAVLTYGSSYIPGLVHVNAAGAAILTPLGYVVAAFLCLVFAIINMLGVRWMSQVNKYAVWWKIAVPALTILVLLAVAFHPGNFTAGGGFMPYGLQGVLIAVSTGGIVFAYSGFDGAVQFGAESKRPGRNIPFAVIGSMVVGFLIYIGLQVAFIGSIDPSLIRKGWAALTFSSGALGPFAALAGALGLGWLAFILYIDAIISPAGTGLLALGAGPRALYALARNRYIPAVFGQITTRGVPLVAIVLTFVIGLFVFLPFPGWSVLVGFASSAGVICYSLIPVALGALRRQDPDRPRPFRLPAAPVLAPAGFAIANELILFAGFGVVWKLLVAILVGFALLAVSAATRTPEKRPSLDWSNAHWLWPWLVGMAIIAYLSSFDVHATDTIPLIGLKGPIGVLPFGWDMAVMAAFALVIYWLAMRMQLAPDRSAAYIEQFSAEAADTTTTPSI